LTWSQSWQGPTFAFVVTVTQPGQRRTPKVAKTNSVAKKAVVAVTGIIMVLYLIAHMIGNLKVFAGRESFNGYSEWIRTIGEPVVPAQTTLTIIRIVLLTVVIAHFWAVISLWRQAKRARPHGYVTKKAVAQSYASRTMRWGGVIVGLFIVYHILDLTMGVANPEGPGHTPTTAWSPASPTRSSPRSTCSRWSCSACTCGTASGAPRRPSAEQQAPGEDGQPLRPRVLRGAHRRLPDRPLQRSLRPRRLKEPIAMPLDLFSVGDPIADTKAPRDVPIGERWSTRRFRARLVNPANRRKLTVIVVGTGLAGGSAAATLGEAGYKVKNFWFHDSPRRAHSVAAQGGINAAKNYRNDGDSVHRLFYDTVKGGDFRSREDNVHRLAEVSVSIIDQCVAQGVPFAAEYGGLLDNRSFGGAQDVTHLLRPRQTGQQLLYGAYQALERQMAAGTVEAVRRHEMLDLVIVDGRARGIVARNLITGEVSTHFADAVVLATGGYSNVFYLSTNAMAPPPRRSGGRTSGARTSPTPAIRRSTRPASRSRATTSPSSR
jgi:succinate dehydrogenase/fumarate reductase cytochrome b subunit (b558 family)